MKNPFEILGIERPIGKLSAEKLKEIKQIYRKLVMQHHPDKGGDSDKFKQIQSAWEQIESGAYLKNRVESLEDILRRMRVDETLPVVLINCSLAQAYRGFTTSVAVNTKIGIVTSSITIPPGLPLGHRGNYALSNGMSIQGILNIDPGNFNIVDINRASTFVNDDQTVINIKCGIVETKIYVNALDIIIGSWIEIEDFLGDKFSIKIPAGFSCVQKLKARGRGYFDFDVIASVPTTKRDDLYITIYPTFVPPAKLDKNKVKELFQLVNNA